MCCWYVFLNPNVCRVQADLLQIIWAIFTIICFGLSLGLLFKPGPVKFTTITYSIFVTAFAGLMCIRLCLTGDLWRFLIALDLVYLLFTFCAAIATAAGAGSCNAVSYSFTGLGRFESN